MPSGPALDLHLRRSRWRLQIIAAGALLAWLSIVGTWTGPLPALPAAGLLFATCRYYWRTPWVERIIIDRRGWQLVYSDGRISRAGGLRQAQAGNFVSSVTLDAPGQRAQALFHDSFRGADHKRLRMLLRRGNKLPA